MIPMSSIEPEGTDEMGTDVTMDLPSVGDGAGVVTGESITTLGTTVPSQGNLLGGLDTLGGFDTNLLTQSQRDTLTRLSYDALLDTLENGNRREALKVALPTYRKIWPDPVTSTTTINNVYVNGGVAAIDRWERRHE
jgi:hypothetical protein